MPAPRDWRRVQRINNRWEIWSCSPVISMVRPPSLRAAVSKPRTGANLAAGAAAWVDARGMLGRSGYARLAAWNYSR